MKELIKSWDAMRIVRLVAGAGVLWSAFAEQELLLGLLGGMLLLQAVLNLGCGVTGCPAPLRSGANKVSTNDSPDSPQEVTYEEVR